VSDLFDRDENVALFYEEPDLEYCEVLVLIDPPIPDEEEEELTNEEREQIYEGINALRDYLDKLEEKLC
jgi:hypothetical protein